MPKRREGKDFSAYVEPVLPKTEEAEQILASGYEMSIAEAKQIIKERDADVHAHPFDHYRKAKAMLAAYTATNPQPSSSRQPWVRG